jgi:hypothetical protein
VRRTEAEVSAELSRMEEELLWGPKGLDEPGRDGRPAPPPPSP